jgi:hypothetical protein
MSSTGNTFTEVLRDAVDAEWERIKQRMEPIMYVQTHTQAARHNAPLMVGVPRVPITIAAQEIVLRHLPTPSDIEAVLHLREGIDLSVHAADSNFTRLEKKETTSGWLVPSSWTARLSAPSASFPWATASP